MPDPWLAGDYALRPLTLAGKINVLVQFVTGWTKLNLARLSSRPTGWQFVHIDVPVSGSLRNDPFNALPVQHSDTVMETLIFCQTCNSSTLRTIS